MSTGWDGPPQGQPPYGGQGYPQQGGYPPQPGGYPPQQGGYPPYGGGGYGQPPYGTGPQGYYGQPPKGSGGKVIAIVTTIVVVLAGVGVALYFLVFNKGGGGSTASPKAVVTSFLNDAKAQDKGDAENLVCPELKSKLNSSASDSSSSGSSLFRQSSETFTVHDPQQSGGDWNVPVDLSSDGQSISVTFVVQQQSGKYLICDLKLDGISVLDGPSVPTDPFSDSPSSADPFSDSPSSADPFSGSDSF